MHNLHNILGIRIIIIKPILRINYVRIKEFKSLVKGRLEFRVRFV